MSILKSKSDINLMAAELLHKNSLYPSVVHCSYYSCFQLMKHLWLGKMGKTEGNAVFLNLPAQEMYGKVMSLDDGFLENMFTLSTDISKSEIAEMMQQIADGANPMPIKKKLAYILTEIFHGAEEAARAQAFFESVVQGTNLPEEISEFKVDSQVVILRDLLVQSGLCESNGDAKRMVEEGAVAMYIEGEERRLENSKEEINILDGIVLRVGKRKFIKLRR